MGNLQLKGSKMKTRPLSISIISWFLIVTSAIALISTAVSYNNPEVIKIMELSAIPITLQFILAFVGLTITISSGVLMLKGNNIGRLLYSGWIAISFVITLITSPITYMILPGLIVSLIIIFFLFRPKASEYFSKAEQEELTNDS